MKKLIISFFMVALLFLPVRVFSSTALPGELAKEKDPELFSLIDRAYNLLDQSQKVYRENIYVVEDVDKYLKNFCGENCKSQKNWKTVKTSLESNMITVIQIDGPDGKYVGIYLNSKSNWVYDLRQKLLVYSSEEEKNFAAAALAASFAHEKFHVDNPLADEVEAHKYEKKIFADLSSKLGFSNREGSIKYLAILDQKISEAKNEQVVASVIRIKN